jgi:hypothetical protein
MKGAYWIATIAVAGLLGIQGAALAGNPTQADFDACNQEALRMHSSSGAITSTPSTGGPSQTGPTVEGRGTPSATTSTGQGSGANVAGSAGSDVRTTHEPSATSLQGIDPARHSDEAYRQAYSDCMKRRGFSS